MSKNELGPEASKLWDRLERMGTKNFHADWANPSSSIEDRAKQINFALDQIESGKARIVSDEELKYV